MTANRLSNWRTVMTVWTRAAIMGAALVTLVVTPAVSQAARPGAAGSSREKPLPLAAPRKATFTATEGTWMSVDVSPDGQTIIFDLLGDLYTLPITGGKATRITEGMAFDAQPRFSPDGESVVFVSDRSGGDNVCKKGSLSFTNASIPTFSRPMAFSIPQGVSAIRGGGLPLVGAKDNPLTIIPPMRFKSTRCSNSLA